MLTLIEKPQLKGVCQLERQLPETLADTFDQQAALSCEKFTVELRRQWPGYQTIILRPQTVAVISHFSVVSIQAAPAALPFCTDLDFPGHTVGAERPPAPAVDNL